MDKLVATINNCIVKISKGDMQALDELYSLTSRMLLFMARKYLNDKSYAEDIVSETYFKIVKHSEQFDNSKNGLNWIYKIIHNEAINYNRKTSVCFNCEMVDESTHNNQDIVDEWLDKIHIHNSLQNISSEEKNLIYLRYWEGFDFREISNITGKPLTTIYDTLRRTLKKLNKMMK